MPISERKLTQVKLSADLCSKLGVSSTADQIKLLRLVLATRETLALTDPELIRADPDIALHIMCDLCDKDYRTEAMEQWYGVLCPCLSRFDDEDILAFVSLKQDQPDLDSFKAQLTGEIKSVCIRSCLSLGPALLDLLAAYPDITFILDEDDEDRCGILDFLIPHFKNARLIEGEEEEVDLILNEAGEGSC